MGKRGKQTKQKKVKPRAAAERPEGAPARPWERPGKNALHGGFSGRVAGRPQSNLRQGRGR